MNDLIAYLPNIAIGTANTLAISLLAFMIATVIGFLTAWGTSSGLKWPKFFINSYINLLQGIPDIIVIFIVYFGLQAVVNFTYESLSPDSEIPEFSNLFIGVFCLSIIYGTYVSEVFRSQIQSIHKGQIEAGKAYGLTASQIYFNIVFPQAFKAGFNAYFNVWLLILKGSAILSLIQINNLMFFAQIGATNTKKPFLFYSLGLIIYFAISSLSLYGYQRFLAKRTIPSLWVFANLCDAILQLSSTVKFIVFGSINLVLYSLVFVLATALGYFFLYSFDYSIIHDNAVFFIAGYWLTFQIFVIAMVIALLLGIAISYSLYFKQRYLYPIAYYYVLILTTTPIIIQLFLIYYGLGQFTAYHPHLFYLIRDPFICIILTISLNSAAYIASYLIDFYTNHSKGEIEAAEAFGLRKKQIFWRIILPTALLNVLPILRSEAVQNMHATAFASTITLVELTGVSRKIYTDYYAPFEAYLFVALIYYINTLLITAVINYFHYRFHPNTKKHKAI